MSSIVVSNSTLSNVVTSDAVIYKTQMIDVISKTPIERDCTAIFIRSKGLEIFSNGYVKETTTPSTTSTTLEVDDIYLEHVNKRLEEIQRTYRNEVENKEHPFDEKELKARMTECENDEVHRQLWAFADERSRQPISVPLEITNQISALVVEKRSATDARKIEIEEAIAALATPLFKMICF